jgi:hypothetical protein
MEQIADGRQGDIGRGIFGEHGRVKGIMTLPDENRGDA